MDYFKIFIIIFMIFVLYKLYQNDIISENFENTPSLADDWNAINQLAQISRQLMTGGSTLPGNFTVNGNTSFNGNTTITGTLSAGAATLTSLNILPRGIIVSYNGSSAPTGWVICDGANGTPNLKDRFIIGSGSSYGLGGTGGSTSVTLSVSNLPPHNHKTIDFSGHTNLSHPYNGFGSGSADYSGGGGAYLGKNDPQFYTGMGGGTSSAFSILPPYYALCYIMKT